MSGAVYGEHRPQQGGAWRSSNNAKPSKLGFQQGSDLHDGHGHGAAPLESVHHGRGAKEDPGMNGYRTRIFEGSGSPSSSSSRHFPTAGPPPLPQGPRHQQPADLRLAAPPPPEPGKHPSFDAKVAAEFFRMRDAKASSSRDYGSATAAGGPPPPPLQARAFESDVERAMRDMEARLAVTSGDGNARETARSPSSSSFLPADDNRGPRLPTGPSPATADHHHNQHHGRDEGMLSQMDMRRVMTGGGKGKPGGLRDMWDDGGGGTSEREGRRVHSSGQRHGLGLKGMWDGRENDPAVVSTSSSSLRPKRQGPGLRGLWSGPDMAAADTARSEAQAAYFSALERDNQERRTFSEDSRGQQRRRQEPRARRDSGGSSPYGASSEHGTSLVGIGTPRGDATPRARRRDSSGLGVGDFGEESSERAADRAKKAAYAEELRKQMAEKEARAAVDGSGPRRRRASTGAGRERDTGDGGGGHNRGPVTPRSHDRGSYPTRDRTDTLAESPFRSTDPGRDRWSSSAGAWSTPPNGGDSGLTGSGGGDDGIGGSEGRVTAARRRLVEDVYGGGGMGAALGGAGYRRASTGGYGAGSPGGPVNQIGGGVVSGDDPTANGAPSFLRTGAGVQSLRETEPGDSKWQKRAAALEQQRALEAQIASKARAKREEEERRKREEEEEAREQRERLRQIEAEAEEERRRKQAEQQEQLQGLYRQQEEALRKRRGGGGSGSGGRQSSDGDYARAPAYGGSTSVLDETNDTPTPTHNRAGSFTPRGGRRGYLQSRPQLGAAELDPPQDEGHHHHHHLLGGGGTIGDDGTVVRGPTARRWRSPTVPDVDDLPAGAQARVQVLRSSPTHIPTTSGGGTSAPSPSSWRPGSAASGGRGRGGGGGGNGGGSMSNERPGDGFGAGGRSSVSRDAPIAESGLTGAIPRGRGRTPTTAFDGGDGGGGAVAAAAAAAAATAGPPLRTSSSLVPVTSATLFPDEKPDGALAGSFAGSNSVRVQQSFGGREGARIAAAAAVRVGPPQDEMDAFVTEWQAEHLRRRGRQDQGHLEGGGGGRKTVGDRYHPAPPSPGERTVCKSPARSLLGSSRARRSTVDGGTGWEFDAPREGRKGELEESLAASSRMVDATSLLPQPPARYPGGARVGRQARRPSLSGGDRDESAINLNEQSLTSDSILFYLSGQQREETAEITTTPTSTGIRRASTSGRLSSRGREIDNAPRVGSRLGREILRESFEADEAGERGYGRGHAGSSVAGVPAGEIPLSTLSPLDPGDTGDTVQGAEEDGMMSPLTRLLAETPVRLTPAGGIRRQREAYPTTTAAGAAATARSTGADPHARDHHDDGATTHPSHRPAPTASQPPPATATAETSVVDSLDGGTSFCSRANDGSSSGVVGGFALGEGGVASGNGAARAARRARALWGASPSESVGSVTEAGGMGTVAEALARKGGGVPWEEMSPVSLSSEAPLRRRS